MGDNARDILTRYLPGIITHNPAIKDCFINAILNDTALKNCFINAVKKIAQDKEGELIPWGDDVHWSVKGRHGPGMTEWVKLGEKKYPATWVLYKLLGQETQKENAKGFFKDLGLEISN